MLATATAVNRWRQRWPVWPTVLPHQHRAGPYLYVRPHLRQPIPLLEGCFDRAELEEAARLQLTVPFHAAHQFDWLKQGSLPAPLEVMLKLNTGMNRLGFRPEEAPRAAVWLQARNDIRLAGLMTHFATADGDPGIAAQLSRF